METRRAATDSRIILVQFLQAIMQFLTEQNGRGIAIALPLPAAVTAVIASCTVPAASRTYWHIRRYSSERNPRSFSYFGASKLMYELSMAALPVLATSKRAARLRSGTSS
jgi:hypothetical protein